MGDTRCKNCGEPIYWWADYDGTAWASCGNCDAYFDETSVATPEEARRG